MSPLNITKEHLYAVNETKTINSDLYGSYTIRCVANMAWFQGGDVDAYMRWCKRDHPAKQGWNPIYGERPNSTDEFAYLSLFLPLEKDNVLWAKNNPNCQFLVTMKKDFNRLPKKLPISVSDKSVELWLIRSATHILQEPVPKKIIDSMAASPSY